MRKKFAVGASNYNQSSFARQALGLSWTHPSWVETDSRIPVRDGAAITIRTYIPKVCSVQGSPVAIVFHGGGWCTGGLETEGLLCRILASQLDLVVVNVDYRLYPEVDFPVPVTDCYDAVKWVGLLPLPPISPIANHDQVSQNVSALGGDLSRGFMVVGISVGGTCASIAAYLARDEGLSPPLTGCFLSCPVLNDEVEDENGVTKHVYPDRNRSFEQNENAPLMNRTLRLAVRSESVMHPWPTSGQCCP